MARRSGLGKGLDALIPGAEAEGDRGFLEVPVGEIRPNPYQPRQTFEEGALAELTESIRAVGVLQPVLLRRVPDGYELVAGERRFRAAQAAGLATVPAVVRDVADRTSLEQALVENLQREDLGALEEAAAFRQLVDEFSLTQEHVAERVGRSRPAVANSLRLLGLPGPVQQLLQSGALSAGHARALLALEDPDEQTALAELAAKNEWSVRQVETKVRARAALPKKGGKAGNRTPQRPAAVLEVERILGDTLDTRVGVTMTAAGRGRITIEFGGAEDLDRILRTIAPDA